MKWNYKKFIKHVAYLLLSVCMVIVIYAVLLVAVDKEIEIQNDQALQWIIDKNISMNE